MSLRALAVFLFPGFGFPSNRHILSIILVIASLLGPCAVARAQDMPTGDRAKELLGLKPLGSHASATEREMVRVSHEFLEEMVAERKKHDSALAELTPVLSTVYTAESFTSKGQMQDIINAIKKMLDLDRAMNGRLDHSPEELRNRLDRSWLSAKDKNDVMEGLQSAYGGSELLPLYHEARNREELWVASVVELYSFALQHADSFSPREGKLIISGHELTEQFNLKFKNSRALRQQLHETNEQIRTVRAEKTRRLGLTNSDVGLPEKPKQ